MRIQIIIGSVKASAYRTHKFFLTVSSTSMAAYARHMRKTFLTNNTVIKLSLILRNAHKNDIIIGYEQSYADIYDIYNKTKLTNIYENKQIHSTK